MRSITVITALIVAGLAASAQAPDINQTISAYNEAVAAGDTAPRVKAAKALGEAALLHPEREDAAILAFEAGQTLCLMSDCSGAAELARFAASKPLPGDVIRPEDIALLEAYASWSQKPDRQRRKALDDVLDQLAEKDLTTLTLAAFHNRYMKDLSDQDWNEARESAAQAATHFAAFKDVIGEHWSNAAMTSITASFNHDPDPDDLLAMARHHVKLGKIRRAHEDEPDWVSNHWFVSEAWQLAMSAYFHSARDRRRSGSRIRGPDPEKLDRQVDAIMAELDEAGSSPVLKTSTAEEDPDTLPFCEGTFDMKPGLRYPSGAARRGMFGAVILSVTLDHGEVSDVEVLAAVPNEGFTEDLTRTVEKWTWKTKEGIPGETCRTSHSNLVWPFVFMLGS